MKAGKGRFCFETFVHLLQGLVLVKALVHSLILTVHNQAQQSQPQTVGDFVTPDGLLRASHRLCLTLACTKRLQNQYTQ